MAELEALLVGQNEMDLNITNDKVKVQSHDDPNAPITSISFCTPGCGHTGSFNSFCC